MKSSDSQARLAAAISAVGLSGEILGKLPHQISGGQAQRVNIARAHILDPEVLICDEPVSALDMTVQAQILNLPSDLRESRGLSLFFISHDIRSVAYLCSEITVLKRGSIVESGSRDEVLLEPKTDYMKSLLRAVPNSELGLETASPSACCSQPGERRHLSRLRSACCRKSRWAFSWVSRFTRRRDGGDADSPGARSRRSIPARHPCPCWKLQPR